MIFFHRSFYGKDGLEVYGGTWKAPKWRTIPHNELDSSQMAHEANAFRVESKLFAFRKDTIYSEDGMRVAKRTDWIRGRRSTTLIPDESAYVSRSGRMNRMANMRNKNVTKRIGKPRQRTPLTYSFGRNDPFWFDLFD